MPALCAELILKIIDDVNAYGDPATSRACSEVARYWVYPSRVFVFHTIRVNAHTDLQSWTSLLAANSKLQPDFAVAPHVRRIVIFKSGQKSYGMSPTTTAEFIRLFPSLSMLDLRGNADVEWADLQTRPLSLVRCLNTQCHSLRDACTNIADAFPSLTVLNVRDTLLPDIDSSAGDEEIITLLQPGMRVLTLDSLWGKHLTDLIYIFKAMPSFFSVETLVLRCDPRALELFFESLPLMMIQLKSLHCMPRGSL